MHDKFSLSRENAKQFILVIWWESSVIYIFLLLRTSRNGRRKIEWTCHFGHWHTMEFCLCRGLSVTRTTNKSLISSKCKAGKRIRTEEKWCDLCRLKKVVLNRTCLYLLYDFSCEFLNTAIQFSWFLEWISLNLFSLSSFLFPYLFLSLFISATFSFILSLSLVFALSLFLSVSLDFSSYLFLFSL